MSSTEEYENISDSEIKRMEEEVGNVYFAFTDH
jgi:hypothetical protein